MVIYNVTVNIDESVHEEWVDYMRTRHIPDVLQTGCFKEARFTRVMVNEDQGITYSTQYLCESEEMLGVYANEHAPALQKEFREKYEGKFVVFRTMLEIVEMFEVEK